MKNLKRMKFLWIGLLSTSLTVFASGAKPRIPKTGTLASVSQSPLVMQVIPVSRKESGSVRNGSANQTQETGPGVLAAGTVTGAGVGLLAGGHRNIELSKDDLKKLRGEHAAHFEKEAKVYRAQAVAYADKMGAMDGGDEVWKRYYSTVDSDYMEADAYRREFTHEAQKLEKEAQLFRAGKKAPFGPKAWGIEKDIRRNKIFRGVGAVTTLVGLGMTAHALFGVDLIPSVSVSEVSVSQRRGKGPSAYDTAWVKKGLGAEEAQGAKQ